MNRDGSYRKLLSAVAHLMSIPVVTRAPLPPLLRGVATAGGIACPLLTYL